MIGLQLHHILRRENVAATARRMHEQQELVQRGWFRNRQRSRLPESSRNRCMRLLDLQGSGLVATTVGAIPFGMPGRGSALASPWSLPAS